MQLRQLISKDAPLMLEWMHDQNVIHHLGTNFIEKTLEDCERFIHFAANNTTDLHLAIVNEADEYMGTVSLKHIDRHAKTAEFAIAVRACAMGCGYAQYGMSQILNYGLQQLGLLDIYWCVSPNNSRAVRFYDKNEYQRITHIPEHILSHYCPEDQASLIWYAVSAV